MTHGKASQSDGPRVLLRRLWTIRRRYPALVFISHKRGAPPVGDDDFSCQLTEDLWEHFGGDHDSVWYDTLGGIHAGDEFKQKILRAIKRRPIFVIILSPQAMASEWIRLEVRQAIWLRDHSKREPRFIVPVVYLPTLPAEIPSDLVGSLSRVDSVSFEAPRPYDAALKVLISGIDDKYAQWRRFAIRRRLMRVGLPLLVALVMLTALIVRWIQPGPAPTVCVPAGAVQAGTWGNAGDLLHVRTAFNAVTLPDNQVLIAGGSIPISGPEGLGFLSESELYDPATCVWRRTGSLVTTASSYGETTLADGRIMIAGGYSPMQKTVQLYDPGAGVWTSAPGLATARDLNTATRLVNGDVLVTGGWDNFQLDSTEIEDPTTAVWRPAAPMLLARSNHRAILLADGRVLVIGGTLVDGSSTAECEVYDPTSNTWHVTGSMHTPRTAFSAVLLPSGKVLVAGGVSQTGPTSSAELYDPVTGVWTATGDMHTPRQFTAGQNGVLLRTGNVLVAGGDQLGTSEEYDPDTGVWAAPVKMRVPHCDAAVTLLNDGSALIIGGDNCVDQKQQTLVSEIYTPKS